MRSLVPRLAGAFLATTAATLRGQAPFLQPLGDWAPQSISADGITVVGFDDGVSRGYRWTATSGLMQIAGPPGYENLEPYGVSGNGELVCGLVYHPQLGTQAFRWSPVTGCQILPPTKGGLVAGASGISGDGRWIAGRSGIVSTAPVRWDAAGGLHVLDLLPGYSKASARRASHDGTVTVGTAYLSSAVFRAVRWDEEGRVSDLGVLVGHSQSLAYGVSADGSTIVGASFDQLASRQPVRWTSGEVLPLGMVPGWTDARALAVSGDGGVIVGAGGTASDPHAFIWTTALGTRDLKDYLAEIGLSLPGWSLWEATGISDDGTRIVGRGLDPLGVRQGWIVTIPAPPCALALLVASARPRRRRPSHLPA